MLAKILLSNFSRSNPRFDTGMERAVKPGLSTIYPFECPKYASLDPVVVRMYNWKKSDSAGGECKLWFLGDGYIRLEIDTELYTGRPGKLMWSGIQTDYRQPYDYRFGNMRRKVVEADDEDEESAEMHREHLAKLGRTESEESEFDLSDYGYIPYEW
jgi:hypothetical protein